MTQNANTSVWASIAPPSHRELTGAFVRKGTREDWSRARRLGDPRTGLYLDLDGRAVFGDGHE
ncbi:hypothetical protein [Nannocystis bainbridge]|uniref:Uncharacterized protein n=1 Tax=Nannocystis bainbridge TaxID=2995303 RepID=A0ABT5E5Q3_9BACT|nr:hypothetical protein [Nannocystis bainbridge]MDC0721176.1 hypothetical protein [Nannocystis bainbridge]